MKSSYNIVNESSYATSWYDNAEKSADEELVEQQSLQQLRQSSRKLIKNEAIASAAQSAYTDMMIGGKLTFEVVSKDKRMQKKVQEILDEALDKVDLNGTSTITQLNEMLIASAYSDGDVLVLAPMEKDRKGVKSYFEVVEANRIKTRPKDQSNTLVREGVEYYPNGKLKGYWVIKNTSHKKPISYYQARNEDFEFFPVFKKSGSLERRVAWMFSAVTTRRPQQSRQVPPLTASMELIRYYGKYLEATLVGARVAACFSAFVKTSNPVQAQKAMQDGVDSKGGRKLSKLQPGTISYLRQNEDIEFASPNKPSDNFDKFIMRLQRIFATQQRIPYEILFLDLSETNYSSWRGGKLEVEQNVNRWRRELTSFNQWVVSTILADALSQEMFVGSVKNLKVKVKYPKFKALDEEKTARANKVKLSNKTASQQQLTEEQGTDWEDLQQELDNEMEITTEREAARLTLQKSLEEENGIIFQDTVQPESKDSSDRDTSTSDREGEVRGADGELSDEDKKERRKEDDNW